MASFPPASPPTPCAHPYPPPYAPHALPISFVSISAKLKTQNYVQNKSEFFRICTITKILKIPIII
jgi:hypothetical protein